MHRLLDVYGDFRWCTSIELLNLQKKRYKIDPLKALSIAFLCQKPMKVTTRVKKEIFIVCGIQLSVCIQPKPHSLTALMN